MADTVVEEVAGDAAGVVPEKDYPTREEVRAMVDEVLDAFGDAAEAAAASSESEGNGTVLLDSSQWDMITSVSATHLHAQVISVGLLAMLLGAVVGVALTLHWRGSHG